MKRIFLFSLLAAIVFSSCRFVENRRIKGDGNVTTAQRSITGFAGVETRGFIDIEVSQGDYKVTVEADQNMIPYILTDIHDGNLVVSLKDDFNSYSFTSAKVIISAPALHVFHTSGSGNITGRGKITDTNKMELGIGGSGNVDLDINSPSVNAEIGGSGNMTLRGETKEFVSKTNGSGNTEAYDLKSETVKVSIYGSGNTNVFASVKLTAEIFGSGNVNYKGNPQINSSSHGSGSVSSAN